VPFVGSDFIETRLEVKICQKPHFLQAAIDFQHKHFPQHLGNEKVTNIIPKL
jgi:hypothetical protein